MKSTIKILSVLLSLCVILSAVSVSLTAYAAEDNIVGDYDFSVVDNPYAEVEWDSETLHAFKSSTHAHTVMSDGDIELNDTIWYHYMTGYEVLCLTDHGTVNGAEIEYNGVTTGVSGANGINSNWTNVQSRLVMYGYQNFVHGGADDISESDYINIINGVQAGTYGPRPDNLVQAGRGMFNLPLGNECNAISTNKCHVNTYNVAFGHGATRTDSWPEKVVVGSYEVGGFSRINHIGEWTDGNGDPSVYDSNWINDFVGLFEDYSPNRTTYTKTDPKWNHATVTGEMFPKGVIGMELVNTSDNRTRNDRRYVYDESLKILAPQGINIYGFCEDDSHEESDIDKNAQYFLVNDGTAWSEQDKAFYSAEYPDSPNPWYGYTGDITTSMATGQFYASSKNSKNSYELGDGFSASGDYPSINNFRIDEDKDQIILSINNADKVRIVADGNILDTKTLTQSSNFETIVFDLNEYENSINSYVRIYFTGRGGITYLQPILLSKAESKTSTVTFTLPSSDTTLEVYDAQGNFVAPENTTVYILDPGNYTYTATRPGYVTAANVPFTVTQADIDNANKRVIEVSLDEDEMVTSSYFYVPETIYVDPSDMTTFQYYVDRQAQPDGALNPTSSSVGSIYFKREGADNIQFSYRMVEGASDVSMNLFTTYAHQNELSARVSDGYLSSKISTGSRGVIEWTATYLLNGIKNTSVAYSYVYAPLSGYSSVAASGGFASTKKAAGWLHTTMEITGTVWLAGVHSVSGGSAAYKFAPFGGDAFVAASGVGNITTTGTGMSTASDDSSGGSVDVYPSGSSGKLTIDTSRYTNFNQIPGLMVGLDMNYASSCDSTDDDTHQILNFAGKNLYTLSGVAANTLSGQRLFRSDNSDPAKDLDVAIDKTVPSVAVQGQVYGFKSKRHDRVAPTVTLNLEYVDKSELRTALENAVKLSYQKEWFKNESDYDSYISAIKEASLVLGNPASNQTQINNAKTALTQSTTGFEFKEGVATVNYRDVEGDIIETVTHNYTITDTLVFSAEEFDSYTYNSWNLVVNGVTVKSGTETYAGLMSAFEECTWNFFYDPDSYDVVYTAWYDEYSPEGDSVTTATYNRNYTLPLNKPQLTGYDFTGWYLDNSQQVYAPGETIKWEYTSGGQFYAVYEAQDFIATFDVNGGSPIETTIIEAKYAEYINLPTEIPVKAGHNFTGWEAFNTKGESLGIFTPSGRFNWDYAENITFVATWEAGSITVTFDPAGGSVNKLTKDVTFGSTYGELPTPTRSGYKFNGWFADAELTKSVDANTEVNLATAHTLYAKWTANEYKVVYFIAGTIYKTEYVPYGEKIVLTEPPVKEGYTFSGWSSVPETMPATAVTVYGSFAINSYTYRFFINGEEQKDLEIKAAYGEAVTAPVPELDAYSTFSGWSPAVPSTMGSTSLDFYGTVTKEYVEISYDINGASGQAPASATYEAGSEVTLPGDDGFYKTGYVFKGWSTDSDATEGFTVYTVPGNDETLFAAWSMMNIYVESADDSETVIDEINDLIYGIDENLTPEKFEDEYIEIIGSNGDIVYETGYGFGTGTKVLLKETANNTVIATYTLVVYGDVDGDGKADGQDVILAQLLADGILGKDDVSKAVFEAADCNHDDAITDEDVNEIINSGLLTFNIIQTK